MMAYPQRAPVAGQIIPMERRRTMDGKVSGCITGIAQDIETTMIRLNLPGRHQTFLHLLNKETFHVAGFHVQHGEEEHWCVFDLARWTRILAWQKSHVLRVRDRLVSANILVWEPDPIEPGQGRLGWNLDISAWERTGAGGSRPGAGRPSLNQKGYVSLPAENNQTGYENNQTGYGNIFKQDTHVSCGGSDSQESHVPKKDYEETLKKFGANAPDTAVLTASPVRGNPSPKAKSVTTESPPTTDEPETPLNTFRGHLLGMVRATYPDIKAVIGKELGAIKRLHASNVTLETVQACWDATLIDPYWETATLSLDTIANKMPTFLKSPENYRAGMQRKRTESTRRIQQAEGRSAPNGRSKFTRNQAGYSHNTIVATTARRVAPGDDD